MASASKTVNLHPDNYLPSNLEPTTFDVIVIGSGPCGRQVASKTAAAGLSTMIIEDELWGGDCPFWACMPSKALLRPGEALAAARQVGGAKQLIENSRKVDIDGVFARRDKIVHDYTDQSFVNLSLKQKCSVVRGKGSLLGEKKVLVKNANGQEKTLSARHAVVISTGSEPVIPDIKGIHDIDFWTPREATSVKEVPEHLIIIGAGVVGSEMATAFATYGSKVSVITPTSEILPRYEPEASRRVREALIGQNVDFHLSSRVVEVWKQDANVCVKLSSGTIVTGSTVLLAAGRRPRTKDIGLESIGVTPTLDVDPSMLVNPVEGQWLYAVGDTNMRAPMTHMGEYQGRIAASAIIARSQGTKTLSSEAWSEYAATADSLAASQVVVTDPNLATVGLTLA
ncbi:mercuric reductase/transcriptional regulator, fusion [Exophiala viscosa]|uniref:Mercuric reductase/transcriptional regulator, fusion n=1 Tax=Exophiala viscosa TaxID=2486360 RepID=A0AAN6DVA1_9EURO|nr:mercuric reductase/transcriptional regulator, fusion [Exophiala viscosa]KAI1623111.1 mercuric reductase/transcriptional regulator, fusion [Exophiala viscosa]